MRDSDNHSGSLTASGAAAVKMRDLLSIERVVPNLRAHRKQDVLRKLAAHAAIGASVPEEAVARAVLECVELPAFGPGAGVSLPHAFLPGLPSAMMTFARLEAPVDFGAADGSKTDLVALLLSPAERPRDHLRALACIARTLRDSNVRDLLRGADSREALYVILCGKDEQDWVDEPAARELAAQPQRHADG